MYVMIWIFDGLIGQNLILMMNIRRIRRERESRSLLLRLARLPCTRRSFGGEATAGTEGDFCAVVVVVVVIVEKTCMIFFLGTPETEDVVRWRKCGFKFILPPLPSRHKVAAHRGRRRRKRRRKSARIRRKRNLAPPIPVPPRQQRKRPPRVVDGREPQLQHPVRAHLPLHDAVRRHRRVDAKVALEVRGRDGRPGEVRDGQAPRVRVLRDGRLQLFAQRVGGCGEQRDARLHAVELQRRGRGAAACLMVKRGPGPLFMDEGDQRGQATGDAGGVERLHALDRSAPDLLEQGGDGHAGGQVVDEDGAVDVRLRWVGAEADPVTEIVGKQVICRPCTPFVDENGILAFACGHGGQVCGPFGRE